VRASEAWESFSALLDHPDRSELVISIGPDDPAQVLYTSGTESRPKGAVLAHGALIAQYTSCIIDGGMDSSDVEPDFRTMSSPNHLRDLLVRQSAGAQGEHPHAAQLIQSCGHRRQ
jgi:acyl-CoA synthetase (AMP-forming)/AMP-acid ligase II